MIYNIDQLIKHNQKFYDSFIDLKVVGWKTYSAALDQYTSGFFKAQLKEADSKVEQLGEAMKKPITIIGVCK